MADIKKAIPYLTHKHSLGQKKHASQDVTAIFHRLSILLKQSGCRVPTSDLQENRVRNLMCHGEPKPRREIG
jgi:hypothetical protein